jgi:hypothetical protein
VQENVSLLWGSGADVVGELYLAGLVSLDIVKHVAENVVVIHIFYDVVPQLMNKRVTSVTPRSTLSQAWNSHQWDVVAP